MAQNALIEGFIDGLERSPAAAPLEKLRAWSRDARGAYAPNTERAWRADWRVFRTFCEAQQLDVLPASGRTVASFIRACVAQGRRPATIRRYLATIARAHQAAECVDPCRSESARLAMRAAAKEVGSRQKQASGFGWEHIERFLALPPQELRDYRDRAMLMVAYDTTCRSEELVALDDGHVTYLPDGDGTVLIDRAKSDQEGKGALAYLSHSSVEILSEWIERAPIKEGALFRAIKGHSNVGERLKPAAVATVFERCMKRIARSSEELRGISGHSVRVGATQDQSAANIDILAIMQSGRWADPRMVKRYAENLDTRRSGMARLAALQGRAKPPKDPR